MSTGEDGSTDVAGGADVAGAADGAGAAEAVVAGEHFSTVDSILFSLLLVVSVGIGVWSAYKSHGRETTQDYLLGGRNMSPYPVGLSLLGGIVSAISILGNPTEMYLYGTQLSVSLVGVIFGCVVVHYVILPIFYHLKLVSISEYLEMRFESRGVRKLGTFCQLLTKFFYMGICLYAPSLALSTVTSFTTWASMVTMGLVCTFYITVGGVKAVVYTDVFQTLLMFGGVLLVVAICCVDLGGVANVWELADRGGRIQFFNMDPSPFVRHTFWSTIVFGFYLAINVLGINQPSYQRFASVGSLITAQRLNAFFGFGLWVLWGVFFFSGLVAYAAYSHCDPFTSSRIEKADQVIPYLVMEKLGHLTGIPGIFVAAVYGGVLSSLSSCGNAVACLIWEDLLKEIPYFRRMSNVSATRVLKLISMIAGLSSIFLGVVAGKLGNIFHVVASISGSIMGPLQGVFLAGILLPWVHTKGVVTGFVVAFSYNMWVVVGKFVRGGGKPPHLPFSIDGCPENLLHLTNATTTAATMVSNLITFAPPDADFVSDAPGDLLTDTDPVNERGDEGGGGTIYDVSYCYFGMTGIILTMVVSSLVSICNGPLSPKAVEERLLNPTCARLYRWLWRLCRRPDNNAENKERPTDHEATLAMLPASTTHHPGISHN